MQLDCERLRVGWSTWSLGMPYTDVGSPSACLLDPPDPRATKPPPSRSDTGKSPSLCRSSPIEILCSFAEQKITKSHNESTDEDG
jgi:hypothetical protein